MTDQIKDRLLYQDNEYVILGIAGDGLLSPSDFGMEPVSVSRACYRGYFAKYSCVDKKLVLTEMTLRLAESSYKAIDGIYPNPIFRTRKGFEVVLSPNEKETDGIYLGHGYRGLGVATTLSGGLLAGKDLTEGMQVWGWPFSYDIVLEFLSVDGEIETVIDRSARASQIRKSLLRSRVPVNFSEIDWGFSLDYDFYYPLTQATNQYITKMKTNRQR